MKRSREERRITGVNVEMTPTMLERIDKVADENETSRSSVVRLAVKKLLEQHEVLKATEKNGGAK